MGARARRAVGAEMRRLSIQGLLSYGRAKILTLLVLVLAIYWADVEELVSFVTAGKEAYVAFALLVVLGIYVFLKRHVVDDVVEIRNTNLKMGILLLLSSGISYLVGSYSDFKLMCHMASLVLFASSYFMVRMNDLILRISLPILATVFAFSLLAAGEPFKGAAYTLLLAAFASSAILFSGLRNRFKISAIVINAPLYFLLELAPLQSQTPIILACAEALLTWLFMRKLPLPHSSSRFEEVAGESACYLCGSSGAAGDFCPFCGRNLAREAPRSEFEVLEVSLFFVFFIAAAFISIPTLVGGGDLITLSYLRFQGPVQRAISFSSDSWLLYEGHRLYGVEQGRDEEFAFKEVLVPERFPETKNYTVVFELAPLKPSIASSWRFAPYKVQTTGNVMMGSFAATYYEVTSKDTSLKVIVWTEKVNLLVGEHLVTRTVGVSVFRNFTYATGMQNATYASDSDKAVFLEDVEQICSNTLRDLTLASSWSYILHSARTLLSSASGILLIALVAVAVVGVAMFSISKGDVADSYSLELLSTERLSVLLAIDRLRKSGIPTTGENLFAEIRKSPSGKVFDREALMRTLEDLEAMRLVERHVRLGTTKALLEWGLAF